MIRLVVALEVSEPDREDSGVITTTGELVRYRPIRKVYAPRINTLSLGGTLARVEGWLKRVAS